MDMEFINKLKGMTKDDIGRITVKEMPILETIWNLILYVKELERQIEALEGEYGGKCSKQA